jgi:hypothetical protein
MRRPPIALADLADPPDTSKIAACDEAESAAAIDRVRSRLMRRRKALLARAKQSAELDRLIASLRRLQNPQLTAYAVGESIILSEPFNGIARACPIAPAEVTRKAADVLFGKRAPAALRRVLAAFGEAALACAREAGITICIVPSDVRFSQVSASVARCVPGIDDWSAPPSGLFIVEDRRVLLRDRALAMTAAHEFAHALDASLATRKKSYYSFENEELRYYFATANETVDEITDHAMGCSCAACAGSSRWSVAGRRNGDPMSGSLSDRCMRHTRSRCANRIPRPSGASKSDASPRSGE